ncbi:DUF3560 domain-containing protein [Streptosporangium sp. NPDC051022]|uniref:DUF3560 domain-containing protein n=1 Tax=Streptosporangium sp. NPDC051022 TaxID=3155752 RepID=UPI0034154FFE
MITVHCSSAEGITVTGTSRADGSNKLLGNRSKGGLGLKWGSHIDAWYVPHSRDRHNSLNRARVEEIATRLRGAGFTVEVEYSDQTRTAEARETELYERADARADAYTGFARNAARRSDTHRETARAATAGIPLGQPILLGHHSQRRHERALERSDNHTRKAIAEGDRAAHWAGRANAAAHLEEHRKNPGVTRRRIERLEEQLRRVQRAIDGTPPPGRRRWYGEPMPATGEHLDRLQHDKAQLADEIAHWGAIIAQAEAEGVKIWGPDDFQRGDFVLYSGTWWEIKRVNKKTLTVPWGHLGIGRTIMRFADAYNRHGQLSTDTDTLPYDKVQGHMSAADAAEKFPPPAAV